MKIILITLLTCISFTIIGQQTINKEDKSTESEYSKFDLNEYKIQFIADTIYTHHLGFLNDSNLIFYNQDESILINEKEAAPYFNNTSHKDNICQIGDKVYYYYTDQNKNIQINKDKPILLNIKDLKKYDRNSLRIDYPRILYSVNDSLFMDNFDNPGRIFIYRSSTALPFNENYAWIPSKGKYFTYHIDSNTLVPEPNNMPYYGARDYKNHYALPYYERTDTTDFILLVYDLNFNPILTYDKLYSKYCNSPKLLLVYSKNRPTLGIYKGEVHTLPFEVESAKRIPAADLMLLTNYESKVGVINSKMELVQPFEFDKCYDRPYNIPHFILKTDSRAILVDGNGEKLLKGEYQNIDFINDERLKVVNEKGFAIIDLQEKIIIPFQEGKNKVFSISKTGSTKTIHAIGYHRTTEIYTYDGELIASIEDKQITEEEKQKFYYNKKLIKLQGLSFDQVIKINPSMLWKGNKKDFQSLINFNGDIVVGWSKFPFHPLPNNRFLYRTKSKKLGIIEYSPQND